MRDLKSGDIIRNTYTVQEHIGSGAFGDVYLVLHKFMGAQAMKILSKLGDNVDDDSALNEAFLLSKIGHPNIVRVFEANHIDDENSPVYVTMEYVNGDTLREIINEFDDELPINLCIKYIKEAAAGLCQAHSMDPPIVHRDIRPENLLVKTGKLGHSVLVGDFGLASSVNFSLGILPAAGAIPYESPEGLNGYESTQSDIFSLGLCFYEILTGIFPFKITLNDVTSYKGNISNLVSEAHEKGCKPVSYFRPAIPAEVEATVSMMMEFEPENRFKNGCSVMDVLQRCENSLNLSHDLTTTNSSAIVKMLKSAFKYKYIHEDHQMANEIVKKIHSLSPELNGRFSSFID